MTKFRTVWILREGKWVGAEFEDLKKGDYFRVFERDGEVPLVDNAFFYATSDAFPAPPLEGNWGVKAEKVPLTYIGT